MEGEGRSLAEAFAEAATALTAVVTDPATVRADETVAIEVSGSEVETLLYDWLNALVFEMATRRMLFSHFAVQIDSGGLHAEVGGEAVDRARHQPAVEVKGATFTALEVRQLGPDHWRARCVVDV